MKLGGRRRRRALAVQMAKDLETKPYSYWAKQQFPIAYQTVCEGEEVTVEIHPLEFDDNYIHVSVSVDAPGYFYFPTFPVGTSFIVRKRPDE